MPGFSRTCRKLYNQPDQTPKQAQLHSPLGRRRIKGDSRHYLPLKKVTVTRAVVIEVFKK